MKKSFVLLGLAFILLLAIPTSVAAQRGCHGEHYGGGYHGGGWHGEYHGGRHGGGYNPGPYYAPAPPAPRYNYGPGPCSPGFEWVWIRPHWIRTPYGDQWVDGHWEQRRLF